MTSPLIFACLWVLAATGVAFLPMRSQYIPGLGLLIGAPVLLVWIALDYGPWVAGFASLAVLSMFRRPLIYLTKRAMGR